MHTRICMHAHACTHMHHTLSHAYTHMHMRTWTHVRACICMCICTCITQQRHWGVSSVAYASRTVVRDRSARGHSRRIVIGPAASCGKALADSRGM